MSPPTGVSVSTIAATATATECHMLKIEGYKRLRTMHGVGTHFDSCPFQAAGRTWRIHCYPNGSHHNVKDHVSLYLVLDAAASAGDIHVEVELSLVPQPGVLGALWPPYTWKDTFVFNGKTSPVHGFPKFIERQLLEAWPGFFHDDGFAVRCDVTVIGKAAEKDPVVQARDLKRLGVVCHCSDETCKRYHSGAARSVMWIREAFVKLFLGCFRV
ncbi:hypothetical protein PR202_gb20909 [Eleusine coracana subsp. coracana]|uniref:MATH domain-containing protein n=1 Tax=Eleusine coracana subsp. coracana TaxID=191504 RepID=A0AAV5FDR6_ELECO|nr:hypothetical protein PR202_gb20909 [Eleusine coracana subsp. coracana]